MYYLGDYLLMIANAPRVDAYAAGIRAVVRPGDRVLEIGAGFGFFSVLAARAGAAHVDAVELNPIVHLGPRVAADNGCRDRITFHACDAQDITLADRADVLIADLRGPTPLCSRALEIIIDARTRLLRPGATIIAARDTLYAAPCVTPAPVAREIDPAHGREGIDLRAVERVMFDTPIRCQIDAAALVGAPTRWATVDYASVRDTDVSGDSEWVFAHNTVVRGIAVWFESEVAPGITLAAGPSTGLVYGQMFVPFSSPINVAGGDTFTIALGARLAQGDYVWTWRAWLNRRLVRDQNSLAERVIDPRALAIRAGHADV